MNAQPNHLPLESLRGLYDDVELTILYDWLQIPRPAALADIDLQGAVYDEEPTAEKKQP